MALSKLRMLVEAALDEDIGHGDVTTLAAVPAEAWCHARLTAKQDGVLSGIEAFRLAFELLHAELRDWEALSDGAAFSKGQVIASFTARTQAVLTGERVAINFVQHLSGIATLTAQFVQAAGQVRICETRKTTPLLRTLEKQAVVHGGGANHRFALFDGILIKENHILAAGDIEKAIERVEENTHHLMKIGVEVTTLDEFDRAVDAGADAILLDHMPLDAMREAARRTRDRGIIVEASGNITLDRVPEVAATGVDIIAVGALTHSAPATDLSLGIENV